MRETASERESGRENDDRSSISDQGRRWERPCRTVADRRDRKLRKAGVAAMGAPDSDSGFEIGIIGKVAAIFMTYMR